MNKHLQTISVAVGILQDKSGRILIAERQDARWRGYWEFPGGKCEIHESPEQALVRELQEEIGIISPVFHPLLTRHAQQNPDFAVKLHCYLVTEWENTPHSVENQPLKWVFPHELSRIQLLPSNHSMMNALRLPDQYAMTGSYQNNADFLRKFQNLLAQNLRLIRLRDWSLDDAVYFALAQQILPFCKAHDVKLILDRDPLMVRDIGADGVHLTRHALAKYVKNQINLRFLNHNNDFSPDFYWAASCHDAESLAQAMEFGCDFAVLSCVLPSTRYAAQTPESALGWEKTAASLASTPLRTYALGGLQKSHLLTAKNAGAQGIAGISAWWQA